MLKMPFNVVSLSMKATTTDCIVHAFSTDLDRHRLLVQITRKISFNFGSGTSPIPQLDLLQLLCNIYGLMAK